MKSIVGGMRALVFPRAWLVLICFLILLAGCQRPWSFAVLGDADIGGPGEAASPVFPRILAAVNEKGPDLVFFTGDLVHGRTLFLADFREQYRQAAGILRDCRAPFHLVPGNHDAEGPGGLEEYLSRFGPVPWVFHHRGWRFIGLNTEMAGRRGAVTGEQLRWLREQLSDRKENRRTVLFMHRPVWPTLTGEYAYHSLPRPELHRLFAEAGVAAVFSGHEHHFHREVRDGVLYVVTGGAGAPLLKGGTFHVVFVEVRDGKLQVRAVRLEEKSAFLKKEKRSGNA